MIIGTLKLDQDTWGNSSIEGYREMEPSTFQIWLIYMKEDRVHITPSLSKCIKN